jgi:hypothetical protein
MSLQNLVQRWGDVWRMIDDSWASHDHVRHWMYLEIYETLAKLDWGNRSYESIEFGSRDPSSSIARMLVYILGDRMFPRSVEYPQIDLHKTPYADGQWDITIADQVLEHTLKPWVCAEELHRITQQGGLTIVATPIIHPIHPNPVDCWRIMPDGYKVLFPEEKWEWLTFGMWGDMQLVGWEIASPVTRGLTGNWLSVADAKATLPNYGPNTDSLWPVVAWLVARKR